MKLATVLCGGANGHTHAVTEDEILELEREAFLSLCGEPLSQARMQYMLQNNKPLQELRRPTMEIVILDAVRSAVGRGHKGYPRHQAARRARCGCDPRPARAYSAGGQDISTT